MGEETRISQVVLQAALDPATHEMRVSQVVLQVAISGGAPGTPSGRSWAYIIG